MKNTDYKVSCLITGKTENLKMFPARNEDGKMIGWVFIHEDINMMELQGSIKWDYAINNHGGDIAPSNPATP